MPLKKSPNKKAFSSNVKELLVDNKKSGKAKGANGKARPMKQILAIAYAQKKK